MDFSAHSRPSEPLEIDVLMGRYGATLDPDAVIYKSIRPGPAQFDISNQSAYSVRFSVRRHGRTLAHTPRLVPGQTAQLQVTLTGAGLTFNTRGADTHGSESSSQDLKLRGRLRTGNNDITQP